MNKINLGSGKSYLQGYLNVDIDSRCKPDLVCDFSKGIPYSINQNWYDEILAIHVLEHVPDLISMMTNLLLLLKEGGVLKIEVPYELSLGAWQDPTHVRAFNENSWIYYNEWCWYINWEQFKFNVQPIYFGFSEYGTKLSAEGKDLLTLLHTPRAIDIMKVDLIKVKV